MTRITNFGRKRTYLEAGFEKTDVDEQQPGVEQVETTSKPENEADKLPKKPRKRRKKAKVAPHGEADEDVEEVAKDVQLDNHATTKKAKTGGKHRREEEKHAKAAASERRRVKRIEEKHATTTCLACRKKGHTVKDCPDTRIVLHEDDTGSSGAPGKSAVGVCYRCGSKRHNLSRCKKTVNPANPLPFASCFVCSGKGHLASSCPQNQGKGIYPNGGSCKLCGQTSHLAKDCGLRTQEIASKNAMLLGDSYVEGGADEDDFHVLKRRRDAVQKEEGILQKLSVEPLGSTTKPKTKVVVFQ